MDYESGNCLYWQRGKNNADGYDSGAPQMMDFPMQQAVRDAVNNDEGWNSGLTKLYHPGG